MLLYNDNINLDIFSAVDQVALELSRSRPFEFTRREAEVEDKKLKDMEEERRNLIAEGTNQRPKDQDDRIVRRTSPGGQ